MRASAPLLLLFLAACAGTAPTTDGEQGRGLIAFDPQPPAGAEVFQRPQWRVGDQFTLLRGGRQKLQQKVVAAGEQGYELEDQNGARLFRDPDFGMLGQASAAGVEPEHRLAPRDVRYHWPLWVGKSWKCEYVETTDGQSMPFAVGYVVEGEDTLQVPAGTFRCLRIRRTSARATADAEQYFEGTMLIWYAADPGIEVRQVISGLAIDLVEWTRAPASQ